MDPTGGCSAVRGLEIAVGHAVDDDVDHLLDGVCPVLESLEHDGRHAVEQDPIENWNPNYYYPVEKISGRN